MKNKKGFTLIELLATIALLGVVLTIATISISSIGNSVKQRQRANIQTDLKIAASKYVANTGTKKVYVATLIEQGYVAADNEDKEIYDPVTKESLNCHYWDFTGDEPAFVSGDCNEETIEYHDFNILYCSGIGCVPSNNLTDKWLNSAYTVLGTDFDGADATYVWLNPLAPDLVFSGSTYVINNFPSGYINETYEVVVNYNDKEYRESVRVKIDVQNPEVSVSVDNNDVWTKDKLLHASFNDNESGLNSYSITNNASSPGEWRNMPAENRISETITQNGTYTVWVKDNAGNISSASIVVDKIDVYPPSVPTTEIRTNNTSGSILRNANNWRNYKIWWGNWYSVDNETEVVRYEYSTNCTGKNVKTLNPEGYSYTNNDYTICIRAVDKFDNASDWSEPYYLKVDTAKPTCGDATGASPTWTNKDREISLKCNDNLSGCQNEYYTNTYTKSTGTASITIEDNAGNTQTCSYSVYIDKDAPTCDKSYDNATKKAPTWTNSKKTIAQECSDTGGSGCSKSIYTKSYTESTTTGSIFISDKAGNTKTCKPDVKLDVTPPTCGTATGASNSWTNANRTVSQGCNDTGGSNCYQKSYTEKYSSTTKTDSVSIKDNAGNTKTCNYDVYVDKTAPVVSTFTITSSEKSFNSKEVNLSASFTEDHSGISSVCITTTNSASKCTWTSYTSKSYSGSYTFSSSDYDGSKLTLYIFVKDNAGNISKSKSASYTIYTACTQKEVAKEGNWSSCSKTCGGGTQSKTIEYEDAHLGIACGSKTETKSCNTQSCCSTGTWSCTCAESGINSCTKYNECTSKNETKTESCTGTINGYRYEGCNKYYITTCTNGICKYTNKNGVSTSGTIEYKKLSTSLGSNCKAPTCGAYISSSSKSGSSVKFETWGSCSATSSGVSGGGCSKTDTYTNGFRVSFGSRTSCTFYMKTQVTATWGETYNYSHSWETRLCGSDTDKAGCYCTYSGSGGSNTCKKSNTACAC